MQNIEDFGPHIFTGGPGVIELAGQINNVNVLTGELLVEIALEGQLDNVNVLTGSMAQVNLEGQVDSVSTLAGTLSLAIPLAGQITATSALTGTLSVQVGLAGVIANDNVLTGDLTNFRPPPPEPTEFGPIVITIPSPVGGGAGLVVPKKSRKGLRFTKVLQGGHESATWEVDCSVLPLKAPYPKYRSEVKIHDNVSGKVAWLGWLKKLTFKTKKKKISSIVFEAEGYYHSCDLRQFGTPVVYGPATTGASTTSKVVVTSIDEAIAHALSQLCPQIMSYRIADTGIALTEDTESFQGKSALAVFNTLTPLTYYLSTPYVWKVVPDPDGFGRPHFDFWSLDPVPRYFERSKAEEVNVEFDAADIRNYVRVGWGNNPPIEVPGPGGTMDYDPILVDGVIQEKFVNVGTDFHSTQEVSSFANGLLARENVLRITGGQAIIKNEFIRDGVNNPIHPMLIEAGNVILLELPNLDPYTAATGLIERVDYDDEACSATLSFTAFDELARNARMLPQNLQRNVVWANAFPPFSPSSPVNDKLPMIGSQLPSAARTSLDARVGGAIVTAAFTDSLHDFGEYGGQVLPENLPINRVDINAQINDVSVGEDRASQPVQDCIMDKRRGKLSIKAREGETGNITVSIDKFKPSTQTYIRDYLTISLTGNNYAELPIVGKRIEEGDWLIYNVDATGPPVPPGPASTISRVTVSIQGHKRWPQFPKYPAPEWVPPHI